MSKWLVNGKCLYNSVWSAGVTMLPLKKGIYKMYKLVAFSKILTEGKGLNTVNKLSYTACLIK